MSTYIYHSFSVAIGGDGVSTKIDIDLTDLIANAGILPRTPTGIYSISVATNTATLSGTVISLDLVTPPSSPSNITIALKF